VSNNIIYMIEVGMVKTSINHSLLMSA